MLPSFKGPFTAPSYTPRIKSVTDGVSALRRYRIPTVSDGVTDTAPLPSAINIDEEADFVSEPRNRSIVPDSDSEYGKSTNVFTLSKSESSKIDLEVQTLKSKFLSNYLHLGATLNLALDHAAAETEAYIQAKFGVDLDVDTNAVAEYANSILDASSLLTILQATQIDPDTQKEVIKDYLLKEFDITRAQLKSKRLAQIQAAARQRYSASLNNPAGVEEGRFAVAGNRK